MHPLFATQLSLSHQQQCQLCGTTHVNFAGWNSSIFEKPTQKKENFFCTQMYQNLFLHWVTAKIRLNGLDQI